MRTIVMLSWEYPPFLVGGLARHVHALARELAAGGDRVIVLTRAAQGGPSQTIEEDVEVLRVLPYFQEPADFRLWVSHLNFGLLEAGINRLRAEEGPVVIHAHDWLVAHAARGLKSLTRMPLIATIHATEHGRQSGIHDSGQQYINDVEWWLTYEAWRVIVCSQAMRREVQGLFGLGGDKVAVIPNGIDFKPAPQKVRVPPRTAFVRPGERLLFFLGRLVPEKGVGVLLEALPALLAKHPLRVVIGGVGPCRDAYMERAAALGIGDRVSFPGWLGDEIAQALYAYSDVTVVPSTYEPFGIVALEAMAAGAPLVASDVGGLAEILRHEENGLKAYPGDPRSLALQIDRLLSNPLLARRLAEAGRREARERYTWSSVARATAAVYDEVLEAWAASPWGRERVTISAD